MKAPKGPTTPPWLRLIKYIFDPIGYMEGYSQRYGDIFAVASGKLIYVANPQAIQEIFTANPNLFNSGAGNRILRYLVGDNSLLLLDGASHRRQKKLLMPPFHRERMRNYGDLILKIAEEVSSSWQVNQPFNLRQSMQEITMRVILQAVFGLHQGERYQELRRLLTILMDMTGSPLSSSVLFFPFLQKDWGDWSPWGKILRLREKVDRLLYAEIDERRSHFDPNATDILSLMISAQDEQGQGMTDQELRDELITLLVAGHETTTTALCWAIYSVYSLADVRDKLLQELDNLGANPEPMTISRLPYLTAICQETLRKYPVSMTTFPRILKGCLKVQEYEFEDVSFLPCIYLIHHREDIYPQPEKFQPERFLQRQYSPYEYFPFGATNRRCLGEALAMLEMKITLAAIASRYHLKSTNKRPVKLQRRGITLAPPSNLKMLLTGVRSS